MGARGDGLMGAPSGVESVTAREACVNTGPQSSSFVSLDLSYFTVDESDKLSANSVSTFFDTCQIVNLLTFNKHNQRTVAIEASITIFNFKL